MIVMKRNDYITIFLILLFLFSTTGMPVVLHHCNTMQVTSFTACEMHSVKPEEKSCCEEEDPAQLFITDQNDVCCTDYLVDESIKETFLTSTKDIQGIQSAAILISDLSSFPQLQFEIKSRSLTFQSPPGKLYIINSVFLI